MNLHITKKQILLVILALFLFISLFTGSYYLLLVPLKQKIDRKEAELKMINQETAIIESKLNQSKDEKVLSTMELQKKVPVKRLLDQLLLDIEKAEIVSDTYISEMKLNGTEEDESIESTENDSVEAIEKIAETNKKETDDEASSSEDETLPNGVKKTSITIIGEADTYFELEKFIDSLQSLQRIVKVESLSFTAPEEIYKVDQERKPIEFEITIAAYYYPKLEDLQKELPPIDTPGISNKKNPFSGFSDIQSSKKFDESIR
ncbi:type IV pilus assembly protein PilO [Bacillus methanolicus PB1]|uniref:Type IV pilus assembly protein PilO n=1 Tax=Bacillus methanolicus PB1 TaxID=997296 RepID=I3DXS1_BACMT|nr:hypothetical protein [Bacillus methanolicus]EIJ79042.1 type IV pilus assembly protein PilO [Bacillus methanolicus PB1]